MASPAAIGAGVGGGVVALAGTSYAAYTQLRPYDDFLDYANRNWLVYIGDTANGFKNKISADTGDGTQNGYRKILSEKLNLISGTDNQINADDIQKAGKDADDSDKAKLNKVAKKVRDWCESNKTKGSKSTDNVNWASIKENADWQNFERLCLETSK
ncbi:hypothetical protein [Candidatus Mycoplasma haematohominis]|uniref:hypothetical protein n=1 Tax=Candidatus Mycoplasma haematohominis TaxID=1494318 RepID=UPI001C0A6DB5|nr:hypothetical protein [Candidatus Mycoplasma haemohominis]